MATAVGVLPTKDNGADVQTRKSGAGTIKTEVGQSQFFSKLGILPIYESNSGSSLQRTATVRFKQMTRKPDLSSRFPRIEDCAHFHYDLIEMGAIEAKLVEHVEDNEEIYFCVNVTCGTCSWHIRRSYENFRLLDKQLHKCIYDRKFSRLPRLKKDVPCTTEAMQDIENILSSYLNRFSSLTTTNNTVNCGPVLNWLEMDNRGNQLIIPDDSDINTPAVAAAHVVKRYMGKAHDEISLEVGDMVSVIDMPPPEDTIWWRGKKGYQVGFFPSECVEVISDSVPQAVISLHPKYAQKPVLRHHGKVISFLRSFFSHRPARTTLKERGIVKERVFGCDLGEHLLNTGTDIPLVLESCINVIETQGLVDGIYRLSGVASNIQKLRLGFDTNEIPEVMSEPRIQDIHSISSLLKMYFRELPNPLLTYQLYDKFAAAVHHGTADDIETHVRLRRIHDVVQQLPPPHYRTCECLMRHLLKVGQKGHETGMHPKNLAIVWAPNLLRSKELEAGSGTAVLRGVGIQAVITEYLIRYADYIFSDKLLSSSGASKKVRPKSLAVSTPGRLLSLEEAREREQQSKQAYIEVGGGTAALPAKYHTVIDLPGKKSKKSPGGGWKSIFGKNKSSPGKNKRKASLPVSKMEVKSTPDLETTPKRRLRSAKSADSLILLVNKRISQTSITIHNPYAGDLSPDVLGSPKSPLSPVSSAPSSIARASSHESFFEDSNIGTSPTTFFTENQEAVMPMQSQPMNSQFYDDDKNSTPRQSVSPDLPMESSPVETSFYIITDSDIPPTNFEKADSNRSSLRAKIAKAISPKSPRKKMKTQSPSCKRRTSSKTSSVLSSKETSLQDSAKAESGNNKQCIPYVAKDESSPDKMRPVVLSESPGARRRSVRRFSEPDGSLSDDQDFPDFLAKSLPEEQCLDVFVEAKVPRRRARAHTIDSPDQFIVTPEDERLFPGMGQDEQMLLTRQASNARVSRCMSFSNAEKPSLAARTLPKSSPNLLVRTQPVARSSVSDDADSVASSADEYEAGQSDSVCNALLGPTLTDLLNMAAGADSSFSESDSTHTLEAFPSDDSDFDTESAQSTFGRFMRKGAFESGVNKQLEGLRASLMKELDMFSESTDSLNEDDSPMSLQAEIINPSLKKAQKSQQRVLLFKEAKKEPDVQAGHVSDAFSVFCPPWSMCEPVKTDTEKNKSFTSTEPVAAAESSMPLAEPENCESDSDSIVAVEVSSCQKDLSDTQPDVEMEVKNSADNLNTAFDVFRNNGNSFASTVDVVAESPGHGVEIGVVDTASATQTSLDAMQTQPGGGSHETVVGADDATLIKQAETPSDDDGNVESMHEAEDEDVDFESNVWQLGQSAEISVQRDDIEMARKCVASDHAYSEGLTVDLGVDATSADKESVFVDTQISSRDNVNEGRDEVYSSDDDREDEFSETESEQAQLANTPPSAMFHVACAEQVVTPERQVATPVEEVDVFHSTRDKTTDAFACFSPRQETAEPFVEQCHVEISVKKMPNESDIAQTQPPCIKRVRSRFEQAIPPPNLDNQKITADSNVEVVPTRPDSLSVKPVSSVCVSPLQDTFSSFAIQPRSPPSPRSHVSPVSSQTKTTVIVTGRRTSQLQETEKEKKTYQRPQSSIEFRDRTPRRTDSYIPPHERYKSTSSESKQADDCELLQSAFDLMKHPQLVERRKKPSSVVEGRKGSFKALRSKFETNEAATCVQAKRTEPPKLTKPWTAIL